MKRLTFLFVFLFVVNLFAQNSGGGFTYVGGDNLASANVTTTDLGGIAVTRFNLVPSSPILVNPAGRFDIPVSSSFGVSKILIDGTSPMGGRVVKIAVATNNAQAVSTQRISTSPGSAIGTLTFVMNPATVVVNSLSLYVAYEPSQQNPNATENTFLLKSITFQDASGNNTVVYTSPGNGVVIPPVPTLGVPADGATITLPYTFNWNAVSGATSYTFQLDTDQNFTTPITVDQTVTTTSYTVSNLPIGTYYWHVRANNSAGSSVYTTTRSAIVNTGITIPTIPTLALPVNGAQNQPTTVLLDWNDVMGATSYRAQVTLANGTVIADQINLTTSSLQVSSLQNNTIYYWRVNATNTAGTSDWSQTWDFITTLGITIPVTPMLISPVNNSTGAQLNQLSSWGSVSGAVSYDFQISSSSNFLVLVFSQNTSNTYANAQNLQYAMTYYWRVCAKNTAGNSAWSEIRSFMTYALTNVDNGNNVPIKFNLEQNYPNPFNPATTIKYQVANVTDVKLAIYNILGEEVVILVNEEKPIGRYEVQFDASKLSSGIYIYKFQAGNFSATMKMILMK